MQVYCSKQHANHRSNRFCTQCGEPLPIHQGEIIANRYKIIKLLGQGGFGRTYLAEDRKQSAKTCVLKEFAPQVEEEQDLKKAKELFEREASVLKKLQHSQIPCFHASLQAKIGNHDFFFLVQDYVEGENYLDLLEKRLAKGQSFNEEEVITLLQKILPVLSYIHSQNVVHRDISPDNLICRRSDQLPVLVDFGGVKQLPASQGFWFTQMGGIRTILGKKGYAPEEQLRQGKAFPSSDLYSLAVTALVLLTGKEPQKLYDSYQGNWYWGKEIKVNPKLEAVLKKMLAYKPSDRYQNANQVLKDLKSPIPIPAVNPHITKLKTMVVAPGRKGVKALATRFHNKTQAIAQTLPMPVWLRPFAMSMIGTTVVALTFVGSWALVSAVIQGVSSITIPTITLPKLPDGSDSPTKPVGDSSNKEGTRISQILDRRTRLQIPEGFFIQTVDKIFYTNNPELVGRSLTSDSKDEALRQEWYSTAEDLLKKIEQAKLSTNARRQLGTYSRRNLRTWQQQAQNGEFGDYTIEELQRETNRKFDRLFPGQRGRNAKLDENTFGQIWYAIAADQVSKLESAN
ncbi:serine/threonine-protein kinase [Fischerella thermalis]|uniref:serine/threonine-protein kinase n=1 Tax=Fischerella thermalis TaxID=372787 RepID=UPI000C80CA9C|nr:serine/threonine-protein kinase [Fischerella thermalis]PLZ11284.1 serine/threonine protein kinase [Fischerella thermalis WC1110]PLZ19982.1 serine/threonine protein kinase [Fischerella thermalis WC341]PLZ30462.1 serine/threonine protein kinase [Fischerella thermalis WC559]PLZ32524.1 serine/threonine protein kinase [Fischerella thermalis WC558]PLZ37419.1 serine/threonine protein kinase [Fischerella thermalis WC542]